MTVADKTTHITYNITMLGDRGNEKVSSRNFFALGNDLQLELVSMNYTTTVYGPDFSNSMSGVIMFKATSLNPMQTIK